LRVGGGGRRRLLALARIRTAKKGHKPSRDKYNQGPGAHVHYLSSGYSRKAGIFWVRRPQICGEYVDIKGKIKPGNEKKRAGDF
jgi:hypothetical protein